MPTRAANPSFGFSSNAEMQTKPKHGFNQPMLNCLGDMGAVFSKHEIGGSNVKKLHGIDVCERSFDLQKTA
jgi:hypothetical protein